MILKEIDYKHPTDYENATHEEIPQEELWEDGEIDDNGLTLKLLQRIITKGDWTVIRRINET